MDSKWIKVLDDGHRVPVDSNGKRAAQRRANKTEVSHKAFLLRSPHGSLPEKLGKRKREHDCGSQCAVQLRKTSLTNYTNFMKSGLPERVLFYQNGDWEDFPKDIVELVREEFKLKKAAVEVQSNGRHFMLDILYMIQVDLKTASQKPIAWIDEAGGCFFPQLSLAEVQINEQYSPELQKDEGFAGMEQNGTQEIKLHLQIELNGVNNCGLEEGVEESNIDAKRIKTRQNADANNDYQEKHVVKVEEIVDKVEKIVANPAVQSEYVFERVDIESVRKIFFQGMKPFSDIDILDINKCSSNVMQTRWELFQKQAELTQKNRGDPNIRYAWLAASKDVLSNTMAYGLARCGSKTNATYGIGVHLTPAKHAVASANYCDVDENEVRHMVFCRVILGNVELVRPGSTQFHPSSEAFDNGVDDLKHPSHYIVWNMNISTHIYPEYAVSFKMLHSDQVASLIGSKNRAVQEVTSRLDHPGKGQIGSFVFDSGKNLNCGSSTAKIPRSPWMPFSKLFEAISPKATQDAMDKVYAHYEEMKSKKMSRQDFILKLRSIVGDELLKSSILGLQSEFPEKAKCLPESLAGKC